MYVSTHVLSAARTYCMRYIANISPLCAMAIISTAARLRAPTLRDYFQRYLSNRVYFGVSMVRWQLLRAFPFIYFVQDLGFALEFHLPYYALRQDVALQSDPRGLRRSGYFIPSPEGPQKHEYLYEAQVSLLLTGVDEWFWTAYCCAETYFGSEESIQYYSDNQLDALTGGEKSMLDPVWNPREYFLSILTRRLKQVTKEWSNIVETLQDRLRLHVSAILRNSAIADSLSG